MTDFLQAVRRFYASSIGKKILVALTGIALVLFLLGHLSGNLLMFAGPKAFNEYATFLHSKPALIWGARFGLLGAVVLHIVATIQLTIQNRLARPEEYRVDAVVRASRSSRVMIWSGLTVLCFVIYHLLHFTVGVGNDYRSNPKYFGADGHHNAYGMVVDGFSSGIVSAFYILSLCLLCSHLSHGFASAFQTLGFTTRRSRPLISALSWAVAGGLTLGFMSIPIAVLCGWVR
jgi:succinate dehydrogenase / fumarate reductase, cytochrome b subunit